MDFPQFAICHPRTNHLIEACSAGDVGKTLLALAEGAPLGETDFFLRLLSPDQLYALERLCDASDEEETLLSELAIKHPEASLEKLKEIFANGG